jgi:hypothetical protein
MSMCAASSHDHAFPDRKSFLFTSSEVKCARTDAMLPYRQEIADFYAHCVAHLLHFQSVHLTVPTVLIPPYFDHVPSQRDSYCLDQSNLLATTLQTSLSCVQATSLAGLLRLSSMALLNVFPPFTDRAPVLVSTGLQDHGYLQVTSDDCSVSRVQSPLGSGIKNRL